VRLRGRRWRSGRTQRRSLQFGRGPAGFPKGNVQLQAATIAQEFLTTQQEVARNPGPQVPSGAQTMPTQG